MQRLTSSILLWITLAPLSALGAENPLGAVLKLVGELSASIKENQYEQKKVYYDYKGWCAETADNEGFAIKTATEQKAKLEATIDKLSSDIEVGTSRIEELGNKISVAESELENATVIRKKERQDFGMSEAELVDAVEVLGRAIKVLEKEMASNAEVFAQLPTDNIDNLLKGLTAVMDAAAISSSDQQKLQAFLQAQQATDDDDEEIGAPAPDAYKSKSGSIVNVMQDMKDKAEDQLADLRKAESNSKHNFEMLKASLKDKVAEQTKDMEQEKTDRAAAEEGRASAEGDLEMTKKDLKESTNELAVTQNTCLNVAADYEATLAAQSTELEVLEKARKTLEESSSSSGPASFLQVSTSAQTQHTGTKVANMVKQLARKHHSAALAQLASRISNVFRFSTAGDAFGKVKGLIRDLIAKLEKEAQVDAMEKAYCDEQMAKTEEKKSDLEGDIEKMTSKIDQDESKAAQLKEDVREFEQELAALAKEQAELDRIMAEDRAEYEKTKADLQKSLAGIRKALVILRNYYGSGSESMIQEQDDSGFSAFMQQPQKPETYRKKQGAGGSIMDILELCESEAATTLAKVEAEHEDAESQYEKVSQENEVTKVTKEQDVKYKTMARKALMKGLADLSADRDTANTELAAVDEFYKKLQERCVAQPQQYEERAARRGAEIKGLKQAQHVMEDEAALVQRKRRSFRGSMAAAASDE